MCTICSVTQTFDPSRHPDGDPDFAVIQEGADASDWTDTTYTMAVGDTFEGTLTLNDYDMVAITLTAGQSYEFTMGGAATGGGTLPDSHLTLYDGGGNYLTHNDDANGTYDSAIIYTATVTGTYYLLAEAFDPSTQGGTYTVGAETFVYVPPENGTLDELADYLVSGYWNGETRQYDTSVSNEISVNITALTAEGQQLARWAFEAWEMVADLDFVETTAAGADMIFDDNQSGAFASSTWSGPDRNITTSEVNVDASWLTTYGTTIDSYSFSTYIHEIGHALGLGHQGPYNGNATFPTDAEFLNDSYLLSVMSYFSQTDNTSVNASYAEPASAMMADIVAIQSIYGAAGAGSVTDGDTTYGVGSTLGNYLDAIDGSVPGVYAGGPVAFTVYDYSGIDLADISLSTRDNLFDLRAEQFSSFGGLVDNVAIARGTVIENANMGSGNDTVIGNAVGNEINGGDGMDSISGFGGHDVINGDGGNDTLLGGWGFDTIDGGSGADSISGEGNADSLSGGLGNDTLLGGAGTDVLIGGDGNDSLMSGDDADRVYGGEGDDVIDAGSNVGYSVDGVWGEGGNDTIDGGIGFDFLSGGDGNDLLSGGNHADNLYGDAGNDTLYGGNGFDRLFGGTDDDLLVDISGFGGMFGGSGNDTLDSAAGSDAGRFFGESGHDLISTGGGNDTIYAGSNNDTINAGTGDDLIWGNFNADTFVFEDGHGNDTIQDFAATNNFERIDLSAISAITSLADLDLGNAASGAAIQDGSAVVIDTGSGNSIRLNGVNLSDLDAADFIF